MCKTSLDQRQGQYSDIYLRTSQYCNNNMLAFFEIGIIWITQLTNQQLRRRSPQRNEPLLQNADRKDDSPQKCWEFCHYRRCEITNSGSGIIMKRFIRSRFFSFPREHNNTNVRKGFLPINNGWSHPSSKSFRTRRCVSNGNCFLLIWISLLPDSCCLPYKACLHFFLIFLLETQLLRTSLRSHPHLSDWWRWVARRWSCLSKFSPTEGMCVQWRDAKRRGEEEK